MYSLKVTFSRSSRKSCLLYTSSEREGDDAIYGDILISIDTVATNAQELGVPFEQELYRVMIHLSLIHIFYQSISSGRLDVALADQSLTTSLRHTYYLYYYCLLYTSRCV